LSGDDFPEWFKKGFKRSPFFESWFFGDIEEMIRDIEEMMEKEFREFRKHIPKNLVREHKLPDGSTRHEWGPFIYGYSMTIGPDGKPRIRQFGNVKTTRKSESLGFTKPSLDIKEEREPLIDVISINGEIKLVAELPGVEKEDIKLHGTEDSITISVTTPKRRYYKEVKIPATIDLKKVKTTYKNGVLEISIFKIEEKKKTGGEPIKIE
jgi:HSP20 family protein